MAYLIWGLLHILGSVKASFPIRTSVQKPHLLPLTPKLLLAQYFDTLRPSPRSSRQQYPSWSPDPLRLGNTPPRSGR